MGQNGGNGSGGAFMAYQTLTFEKKEHMMIIRIIGPSEGPEGVVRLSDELSELSNEMVSDGETRVIILTGAGEKAFSFASDSTLAVSKDGQEEGPIANMDRPVIAAINGDAIGQGLEMALASDIRIASETSRFGLPQIKRGVIPCDGGTQRLTRLVGRGKALAMILTGETIDAEEAYRIGLVNRVVPENELMVVVVKMAREMASKGPIALRFTKEAVYQGMDLTLNQGLRLEADLYLLIHTTKDRTEGIKAFREKKTPKFEGK
jgi:enoyl-CoA hydratase/carnithine racemase